jgi:hypothetical protein
LQQDKQVQTIDEPAEVLKLSDNSLCFVGDFGGGLFNAESAASVGPLGLNIPLVAELLQTTANPQTITGAAHLRWGDDQIALRTRFGNEVVFLVFARQTIKFNTVGGLNEVGTELFAYAVGNLETTELTGEERIGLFDMIRLATVRVRPDDSQLYARVVSEELRMIKELRRPSDEKIKEGVKYAVWPILALHISP